MTDPIVNRVAQSALVTLNLEEYCHQGERVLLDIKDTLFQGLILREKDFRAFISEHDWAQYTGKNVAVTCSADAVVPIWAYMLLATKLEPVAHKVIFGSLEMLENALFQEALGKLDFSDLKGKSVVIKGCSDKPVPVFAYVELTRILRPIAKSIMYGEPCSTVPIYKAPKVQE